MAKSLILLVGGPDSGRSEWARKCREKMISDGVPSSLVSYPNIYNYYRMQGYSEDVSDGKTNLLIPDLVEEELGADRYVIVDDDNLSLGRRQHLISIAKKLFIEVECLYFISPKEIELDEPTINEGYSYLFKIKKNRIVSLKRGYEF